LEAVDSNSISLSLLFSLSIFLYEQGNNAAAKFRQSVWQQGYPLATQQGVKFTLATRCWQVAAAAVSRYISFSYVPELTSKLNKNYNWHFSSSCIFVSSSFLQILSQIDD